MHFAHVKLLLAPDQVDKKINSIKYGGLRASSANTQLIVKNSFFIYLYVKLRLILIHLINKAKRRTYI